jgi:hypothetical protein
MLKEIERLEATAIENGGPEYVRAVVAEVVDKVNEIIIRLKQIETLSVEEKEE